jgi:hypothetical protein
MSSVHVVFIMFTTFTNFTVAFVFAIVSERSPECSFGET